MKILQEAHMYVSEPEPMRQYAKDVMKFFTAAYGGEFYTFDNEVELVDQSLLWVIVYTGEEIVNFEEQVYAVVAFKQKRGLKLVAAGRSYNPNVKAGSKDAVKGIIKKYIGGGKAWTEVSGRVEVMIKSLVSSSMIIDPNELTDILNIDEIHPDGHYVRKLSNGAEVRKIAYGKLR